MREEITVLPAAIRPPSSLTFKTRRPTGLPLQFPDGSGPAGAVSRI